MIYTGGVVVTRSSDNIKGEIIKAQMWKKKLQNKVKTLTTDLSRIVVWKHNNFGSKRYNFRVDERYLIKENEFGTIMEVLQQLIIVLADKFSMFQKRSVH